jgi:hypothetical protein
MSRRLPALAAVLASAAALAALPGAASASTTWLCRPGATANPCAPGLATTTISPTGQTLGRVTPKKTRNPKIDCFYVYPTVSNQPGPQATKKVDPEERSIALYQAARYSSACRIYAPMYRQVTIAGLLKPATVTAAMQKTAYNDVRDAWRDYLKHDNKGRGVVFIGHSQGSFVLRQLIANEVDRKASVRKRLVSAILLGGNVLVKKGCAASSRSRPSATRRRPTPSSASRAGAARSWAAGTSRAARCSAPTRPRSAAAARR